MGYVRTTRRFGYLGGGLLTIAGALGLAVTGVSDPLAPEGQYLLALEVNPAQNLLHLLLGLLLTVGAAGSDNAARTTALVTSAALGMLGLLGLALDRPAGNPLALNGWGNALHLGLAVWGATVTMRQPQPGTTMETVQP